MEFADLNRLARDRLTKVFLKWFEIEVVASRGHVEIVAGASLVMNWLERAISAKR